MSSCASGREKHASLHTPIKFNCLRSNVKRKNYFWYIVEFVLCDLEQRKKHWKQEGYYSGCKTSLTMNGLVALAVTELAKAWRTLVADCACGREWVHQHESILLTSSSPSARDSICTSGDKVLSSHWGHPSLCWAVRTNTSIGLTQHSVDISLINLNIHSLQSDCSE